MLGMSMMLESLGVDPEKLQANVNTAVEHVKQISERLTALESVISNERFTRVETALAFIVNTTAATNAATLRIEEAVNKLATGSPDHSAGFVQEAQQQFPDAAETMQRQIEEGISDARNTTGTTDTTSNTN